MSLRSTAAFFGISFVASLVLFGLFTGRAPAVPSQSDDAERVSLKSLPGGPPFPESPWNETNRVRMIDTAYGGGAYVDPECRSWGDAFEYQRRDGTAVFEGSAALEVSITAAVTNGFQVGYTLDGGEVTWLAPVLPAQTERFQIPIDPSSVETPDLRDRWEFRGRYNTAAGPIECPPTVGSGGNPVTVDVVRG